MFISNILKSIIQKCKDWYVSFFEDNEASEQEIEEFLAQCAAENLEREREGQEAWIDYLAQRKAEEEKVEREIDSAWKNIH